MATNWRTPQVDENKKDVPAVAGLVVMVWVGFLYAGLAQCFIWIVDGNVMFGGRLVEIDVVFSRLFVAGLLLAFIRGTNKAIFGK